MKVTLLTHEPPNKYEVKEIIGVVTHVESSGIVFWKDFLVNIRDKFGGSSGTLNKEIQNTIRKALNALVAKAGQSGANMVSGIKINTQVISSGKNRILQVTVYGTALKVTRIEGPPSGEEDDIIDKIIEGD